MPSVELAIVALHVLGLGLLLWAIRGRIPRTGVRCPTCWYDMADIPPDPTDRSLRCPECGRHAEPAAWARPGEAWRHSHRPRRAIIAAVLIQVACGYYWYQRLPGNESWTGLMPDWALMRLVSQYPHRGLLVSRSLEERFWNDGLSHTHMTELCERYLAQAPQTAHAAPYARPRWVVGIPVVYGLQGFDWLIAGVDGHEIWRQGEVRQSPRYPRGPLPDDPLPCIISNFGFVRGLAAEPGENRTTLTMENAVVLNEFVWSQRIDTALSFQGVDSIEQCMAPLDDPASRRRIIDALAITIRRPIRGDASDLPAILSFAFDLGPMLSRRPTYTTAVRVTLEHNGLVLAEFRDHEARLTAPLTPHHIRERFIGDDSNWDPLRRNGGRDLDLTGVIVRIRPDPEGALADLAETQFWSGEIILDAAAVITYEPSIWPRE